MTDLKERNFVSSKDVKLLSNSNEIAELKAQLLTQWEISENTHLIKSFKFENYKRAMAFVQEVAILAEQAQHHPDICIRYTNVEMILTTNDIGGLSINDFIMAAKIEDM